MSSSKIRGIEPDFDWESLTPAPVIGVDEVGRGCLAGRVYAAAVIIDPRISIPGITDSKLLSEKRRNELAAKIQESWKVGLAFASIEEIDRLNILWAAMLAMKRAVEALGVTSGHVAVDGNQRIPKLEGFEQTTVIKGDQRCLPIAAASIVAKVARDTYMYELGLADPRYGFEKHKGYGTPVHRAAIQKWGPCEHHRRTFAGVREFVTASSPGLGTRSLL